MYLWLLHDNIVLVIHRLETANIMNPQTAYYLQGYYILTLTLLPTMNNTEVLA